MFARLGHRLAVLAYPMGLESPSKTLKPHMKVASVDDQDRVKLSPDVTAVLSASKLTVGVAGDGGVSGVATGGSGVAIVALPEPPPPQPAKSREQAATAIKNIKLSIFIKSYRLCFGTSEFRLE